MQGRRWPAATLALTASLLVACTGHGSRGTSGFPGSPAARPVSQPSVPGKGPHPADVESISLRFDSLAREDGLRLTISTRGDADGRTAFAMSPCCGIEAAGGFVRDVRIRASGRLLPALQQGDKWVVAHPPHASLSVSYRLPPTGKARIDTGPVDQFRPLVDGAWFRVIGHAALLLPERGADDDSVRLNIDASGLATPETFVSSFGAGPAVRGAMTTRGKVLQSLYLGGATHLKVQDTPRGQVVIAHTGMDAGFTATALLREVLGVVDAARDFFGSSQPWYLVSVHGGNTQDPNLRIGGGTGLTNAFATVVASDLDLTDTRQRQQFRWLLAHEYTHQWIGLTIRVASLPRSDQDDTSVYWFSEGFTEFYGIRLLTRSGLQQPAASLTDLNGKLREYAGNRQRNLGAREAGRLFWSDHDAQQIPYLRGYLAAWSADLALRQARHDDQGLDRPMLALVRRAEANPALRVDTRFLVDYLEDGMRPSDARRFRDFVVAGGDAPFEPEAFAPCLRRKAAEASATPQLAFADPHDVDCFRH